MTNCHRNCTKGNQTDSKEAGVMEEYYALARKKGYLNCDKMVREVKGICNFGESPVQNINYKPLPDVVAGK